jgi:hypothetical protein
MTDIYPPAKQRPALLALREALRTRETALRHDECGDWRIEGRFGHIYAVPGSLGWPDTPGFQIFVAGSARWWTNAKAAFRPFAELANDGDDEGVHFVFRLPTPAEAEIIRHYVGVAKKREVSDEELGRLRQWASDNRPQTAEKTASGRLDEGRALNAFPGENRAAKP